VIPLFFPFYFPIYLHYIALGFVPYHSKSFSQQK
jgi:hypothetical protein